eukprot:GFUD01035936.1.p1 GENE.GFUD01035936.1~~GFUD01035936.1.p1  ORF type:complete len:211 (+),score=67.28 GFUD01035936.1:49-681(+)
MGISSHCYLLSSIHTQITMSASKVSAVWSWDSLPSFQDLSQAINNPKDMYAKLGENLSMPEMEKVLTDMQGRLAKLQAGADMDSTLQAMKINVDKLLDLFKEASEKINNNNNRLIQGTLTVFCDVTKELSQKIKEATEPGKGKTPREFFSQPQVKSSLKMFSDQLDWIIKLMEDYMKDNKVSTKSKAPIEEANTKKSWNSKLSFRSKTKA